VSSKSSSCTSRSLVGVVRSPTHLNSAAKNASSAAVSPVSALPNSFSALRVRRTLTRRSCRNSVSMSLSTPSTFAPIVSSRRSRMVAPATPAGMAALMSVSTLFE
jgi:hypothetical protein